MGYCSRWLTVIEPVVKLWGENTQQLSCKTYRSDSTLKGQRKVVN